MLHFNSKAAALLLGCAFFLSVSCTSHKGKLTQMPAMEAFGMLRNDFAVLIDIRDPGQQNLGMAQGALSMPASSLDESKLPKGKRVIVYGATYEDAAKVSKQLADDGFDVGLMGTYNDWVQAKLPTQKH
ncbi:MAG: rhodanese-like domain-containing protein [Bdellovibrionia bacterium]